LIANEIKIDGTNAAV